MTTRREFDRATKEDWGGQGMASDEREAYRQRRGTWGTSQPSDYVAHRAVAHAARNRRQGAPVAVLDVCTLFRAWAHARRARGAPLLGAGPRAA